MIKAWMTGITALTMLAAPPALAASVFDGTWKGDVAASQISKKPVVYSLAGGTYTCSTCVPVIKVPADGAAHPIKGDPYIDAVAITVVDANTIKRSSTKAGKPATESTVTVSPDGGMLSVAYTDMTAANGVPMTGTSNFKRVAAGAAGAHATSGSWERQAGGEASDSQLIFTLALEGDMLRYSTTTGVAYAARLGGPIVQVTGDPGWTTVKVERRGPNAILETDYRDGKKIGTYLMTVAADGTMTSESHDLLTGRKSTYVARRM